MAVGRDCKGRKNNCIAVSELNFLTIATDINAKFICRHRYLMYLLQVIGDGAITGGMAYEAMNHAGFLDKNMIVILNDNQQASYSIEIVSKCSRWVCRVRVFMLHVLCIVQVSLPTQYNGKNQDPVGALSSALARLQVSLSNKLHFVYNAAVALVN